MHLTPSLLTGPLGDASSRVSDQVFIPRARNYFSLAGGGLTGYYPNPDVVPDVSSLIIAAQVFGPKISGR